MASRYTIFLNSALVHELNHVNIVRSFYLRTADLAFGNTEFNCHSDFKQYEYRSLSNYEMLEKLWIELTNENDGGINKITQIVQGFAMMIKDALDDKYLSFDIEYNIQTYQEKTDFATKYTLLDSGSKDIESKIRITINLPKVTSIKTLFECLIHDLAHAAAGVFLEFITDAKVFIVGEMDDDHDEKWLRAASFLMDAFCRQPLTQIIEDHVRGISGDIRGELDITMKVNLKYKYNRKRVINVNRYIFRIECIR